MIDWQSIETAPEDDETVVLGYGQWAGEVGGVQREPIICTMRRAPSSDYTGFNWYVEGTSGYAAWMKPTHWARPAAPTSVGAA